MGRVLWQRCGGAELVNPSSSVCPNDASTAATLSSKPRFHCSQSVFHSGLVRLDVFGQLFHQNNQSRDLLALLFLLVLQVLLHHLHEARTKDAGRQRKH